MFLFVSGFQSPATVAPIIKFTTTNVEFKVKSTSSFLLDHVCGVDAHQYHQVFSDESDQRLCALSQQE